MTSKEKMQKEGITQIVDEAAICTNSIDFIHGKKGTEFLHFVLPNFYTTFRQEDMLLLLLKDRVYKVLVVRMVYKGDCCEIRTLIKQERGREGIDALGR